MPSTLPMFERRPVRRVDIIEIPTLITEITPRGMKAVIGPQSTYLSRRVLRYPDATAMAITSATPKMSAYLDLAKKRRAFSIENSLALHG